MDLYLKKLIYEPTDNPDRIASLIDEHCGKSSLIWADSEGAGNISYLRRKGYKMYAISKPPGSVKFGIGLLKGYRLHIVDCPEWRKEQSSYKYRIINGIKTDEPIGSDHLWDAARYLAMGNFVNV